MQYQDIHKATFLTRPNRFIAHVNLNGVETICHVKNTGRCRELLIPESTVYLEKSNNPNRKTAYDLIAVQKGNLLINMDAQAPNQIFKEWAEAGQFRPNLTLLRGEKTYGNSRFDFYWESPDFHGFVEVKGCTLEENGVARFPDAPTERGVKHVRELILAKKEGYEAAVCIVVQMDGMKYFTPNDITHLAFGDALRDAVAAGVEIFALGCHVTPSTLCWDHLIPVILDK